MKYGAKRRNNVAKVVLSTAFVLTSASTILAGVYENTEDYRIKATQPVIINAAIDKVEPAGLPVTDNADGMKVIGIEVGDALLSVGLHKEYEEENLKTIAIDKEYQTGFVENSLCSRNLEEINQAREELENQEIEEKKRLAVQERQRKEKEEIERKLQAARDAEIGTVLNVPDTNSDFKTFMDYRCITSTGSAQYKLQHDGNATTNSEGFRMYNGEYMVAVGSYYSQKIGTRLRITLDTGKQFYAVVGDHKADIHTDELNQHRNGNVVEFIVDQSKIPSICKKTGNMANAPEAGLEGKVVAIEKLRGLE